MTMTGSVAEKGPLASDGRSGMVTVSIRGANDLGDHVTGTVTVSLPVAEAAAAGAEASGAGAGAGVA
jgi:hypothetical protein